MDILPIITQNPSIATPFLMALMTSSDTSWHGPSICFEALIHLPPTLTSFDIIGSLLRDQTVISFVQTGAQTTVGDLIRIEVLGYFIHECIEWLDNAEREEREGLISDDRFAKGVQNVRCLLFLLFYSPG
jgi:CCR4-NOT transcription complex subunit 11